VNYSTIRTKNAITIASQYPTRHVQIVLRLYDSISQILTGFDVDCACAAYTGNQVYATPRAIAAFMTQCNVVDMTRRSPSYENRLSKYSHRGFEVQVPNLDRSRIDPTIFERSFGRTVGLARLLVLEKLPKQADRDEYRDQRRRERGRPIVNSYFRNTHTLNGNMKDQQEDDVAEWVEEEDVSSYHTFTVPYGPKFHALKLNRLMYTKDLLLNADWNRSKDRTVHLHRHPCFFGNVDDVINDCCGFCPVPTTEDDLEVYEQEKKIYISGKIGFMKDDPGRQTIGSFNPITESDWTEMAYVGNTARLCQAVAEGDLEHVEDWCSQEGVDVNRRDYTGRTPLHLAVSCSTPEVVKCLIDHGARIVARLFDGKTALHIAAGRGSTDMVRLLMEKSETNEQEEADREDKKRGIAKPEDATANGERGQSKDEEDSDGEESDDFTASDSEEVDDDDFTQGSFIKVKPAATMDDVPEDAADDEPDVYDVNVLAWDSPVSPLHIAIMHGHVDVIKMLVSDFGADVLLPVKLQDQHRNTPAKAVLTMALALNLTPVKAKPVIQVLLDLGATSAQADANLTSALHCVVGKGDASLVDLLFEEDGPAARSVLNYVAFDSNYFYMAKAVTPLTTSINLKLPGLVTKLLSLGADPTIPFERFIKSWLQKENGANGLPQNSNVTEAQVATRTTQPILMALEREMPGLLKEFINHGADPSTLDTDARMIMESTYNVNHRLGHTVLDKVREQLKELRSFSGKDKAKGTPSIELKSDEHYLAGLEPGSYKYWSAYEHLRTVKALSRDGNRFSPIAKMNSKMKDDYRKGLEKKQLAVNHLIEELESAERILLDAGAKTLLELAPTLMPGTDLSSMGTNVYKPYQLTHESKPHETKFEFKIPDSINAKLEAYTKL
jgi:Ankyrin repeats (3 copies)/Ankyrin repeat